MKHIFYYPPLHIALVILALGIGAYFAVNALQAHAQDVGLVSGGTGTQASVLTTSQRQASDTNSQIIALLRSLSVINLDDAVFRNPSFSLLSDKSVALPAVVTQGRRNPFAPVGSDNTNDTTDTTTSEENTPQVGQ